MAVKLVLIDCKELLYSRYEGKKRTVTMKADSPLEAEWVEVLRVNPEDLMKVDDDPDCA